MDEEINYKTIRKIQEIEKNSPILSEIKPDFYNIFIDYLKNLIKRLDLEKSSQKRLLLSDEIENTKKIGISIYEYREKKILLAAISKVRGGNPDLKNIINEEKILFDSIYELILKSRKNTIDIEKLDEEEIKTVESKEISTEEKKPEIKQENPNPIIRITQDIPEFIGTDGKKYNLRKNDVISLQDNMSNMLVKRKVAEKINR
jgi:DNA replication initiation complex subunit (GINS family)